MSQPRAPLARDSPEPALRAPRLAVGDRVEITQDRWRPRGTIIRNVGVAFCVRIEVGAGPFVEGFEWEGLNASVLRPLPAAEAPAPARSDALGDEDEDDESASSGSSQESWIELLDDKDDLSDLNALSEGERYSREFESFLWQMGRARRGQQPPLAARSVLTPVNCLAALPAIVSRALNPQYPSFLFIPIDLLFLAEPDGDAFNGFGPLRMGSAILNDALRSVGICQWTDIAGNEPLQKLVWDIIRVTMRFLRDMYWFARYSIISSEKGRYCPFDDIHRAADDIDSDAEDEAPGHTIRDHFVMDVFSYHGVSLTGFEVLDPPYTDDLVAADRSASDDACEEDELSDDDSDNDSFDSNGYRRDHWFEQSILGCADNGDSMSEDGDSISSEEDMPAIVVAAQPPRAHVRVETSLAPPGVEKCMKTIYQLATADFQAWSTFSPRSGAACYACMTALVAGVVKDALPFMDERAMLHFLFSTNRNLPKATQMEVLSFVDMRAASVHSRLVFSSENMATKVRFRLCAFMLSTAMSSGYCGSDSEPGTGDPILMDLDVYPFGEPGVPQDLWGITAP